jgi:DNA-binding MarR family transcriptional regulator
MLTPQGVQALNDIRRLRTDWLAVRLSVLTANERAALAAAVTPLARLVEVSS